MHARGAAPHVSDLVSTGPLGSPLIFLVFGRTRACDFNRIYRKYQGVIAVGDGAGDPTFVSPGSAMQIPDLLRLEDRSVILWVGCGDAREAIGVLAARPTVVIHAIDVSGSCIAAAEAMLNRLLDDNVVPMDIVGRLILQKTSVQALTPTMRYTHIYSTAVSGISTYDSILRIYMQCPTVARVCMFHTAWKKLQYQKADICDIDDRNFTLGVSREKRRIWAGSIDRRPQPQETVTHHVEQCSEGPPCITRPCKKRRHSP
jgi:hypothetical protein